MYLMSIVILLSPIELLFKFTFNYTFFYFRLVWPFIYQPFSSLCQLFDYRFINSLDDVRINSEAALWIQFLYALFSKLVNGWPSCQCLHHIHSINTQQLVTSLMNYSDANPLRTTTNIPQCIPPSLLQSPDTPSFIWPTPTVIYIAYTANPRLGNVLT